MSPPQAFQSTLAPRLRTYANSLLTPVVPPTASQAAPTSRTTKRGTTAVNYAEDGFDDDDFEDSEGPRRPTGLRSLRREDSNQAKATLADKLGKELTAPTDTVGVYRHWMSASRLKIGTDSRIHHIYAQDPLPLTLIPIRIDLDIPAHQPEAPFPILDEAQRQALNPSDPQWRRPDPLPPYRLKDFFLWNLHETLITPDQFATTLVQDLDLPNPAALAMQISNQIRTQLEEYAGVALHPLFHSAPSHLANGTEIKTIRAGTSRDASAAPFTSGTQTPLTNGASQINGHASPFKGQNDVTASASPLPSAAPDMNNLDDTYRCIVTLNINLMNKLYTDKFEWSLLHPPGTAEKFARQTCADLGLAGEWVPAMTHAIYEAVLRLKKEACESGGLVGGIGYGGEIDNLALEGQEAGWRYDNEHLADEWEPKVEELSKEEIEKREGDRERQLRRLRRETARFSSTTNMAGGVPQVGGYFDNPDSSETPMGRGERSKKKRRFRSLSPLARSGTPGARGTPDAGVAGYGGGFGSLTEWERQTWRCSHCQVFGSAVWAVRDGPSGPRSLCNNCGLLYERDKKLLYWSKDLHKGHIPAGAR